MSSSTGILFRSSIILVAMPIAFLMVGKHGVGAVGPEDIYTFCGGTSHSNRDNSACLGFCEPSQTLCSPETGVCSCKPPSKRLRGWESNYKCKPARPRTRCHNACKSYTLITPGFRRGESKVCESNNGERLKRTMCFCLPRV